MSTTTTTKRIDYSQLPFATRTREQGGVWTVDAEVGQATLDAAIAAAPVAPEPSILEANAALLRNQAVNAITTNNTFLAIPGTPTNAQVLAQVKALTRECTGLIRYQHSLLDTVEGVQGQAQQMSLMSPPTDDAVDTPRALRSSAAPRGLTRKAALDPTIPTPDPSNLDPVAPIPRSPAKFFPLSAIIIIVFLIIALIAAFAIVFI